MSFLSSVMTPSVFYQDLVWCFEVAQLLIETQLFIRPCLITQWGPRTHQFRFFMGDKFQQFVTLAKQN